MADVSRVVAVAEDLFSSAGSDFILRGVFPGVSGLVASYFVVKFSTDSCLGEGDDEFLKRLCSMTIGGDSS